MQTVFLLKTTAVENKVDESENQKKELKEAKRLSRDISLWVNHYKQLYQINIQFWVINDNPLVSQAEEPVSVARGDFNLPLPVD